MSPPILKISQTIMFVFMTLLFIAAPVFCFRKFNPAYMRSFPIYTTGNLVVEVVNALIGTHRETGIIFTTFELLYFSYFLSNLIHGRAFRKSLVLMNLGYLSAVGFAWFILRDYTVNVWSVVVECVILVIACFYYYKEVFSAGWHLTLIKEPAFWMVTGILYYFFLLIFIMIFSDYFSYYNVIVQGMADAIYSTNNWVQLISYSLFFWAMICRMPRSSLLRS